MAFDVLCPASGECLAQVRALCVGEGTPHPIENPLGLSGQGTWRTGRGLFWGLLAFLPILCLVGRMKTPTLLIDGI